jgi:hypothetical protein
MAASWSKVFETDLFASFHKAAVAAINKVVQEVEASAPPGLKDRTKVQTEVCLDEAKLTMQKTIEVVRDSLTSEQKEISRCLAPHVQNQLVDGYDRAMEERGKGSVARQKVWLWYSIPRNFINYLRLCSYCFIILLTTAKMTCLRAAPKSSWKDFRKPLRLLG